MKVGCVKEIKTHEYRVGLTPSDVKSYVTRGHEVQIQANAGVDAGFEDEEYLNAGAIIVLNREDIFASCEMIVFQGSNQLMVASRSLDHTVHSVPVSCRINDSKSPVSPQHLLWHTFVDST